MPDEPLFDRAHLHAQTAGDATLARELVALFGDQCRRILPSLADVSAPAPARADLAHTLKGSALGIGANRLAACAAEVERRLRRRIEAETAIADLHALARATLAAIARDP